MGSCQVSKPKYRVSSSPLDSIGNDKILENGLQKQDFWSTTLTTSPRVDGELGRNSTIQDQLVLLGESWSVFRDIVLKSNCFNSQLAFTTAHTYFGTDTAILRLLWTLSSHPKFKQLLSRVLPCIQNSSHHLIITVKRY